MIYCKADSDCRLKIHHLQEEIKELQQELESEKAATRLYEVQSESLQTFLKDANARISKMKDVIDFLLGQAKISRPGDEE